MKDIFVYSRPAVEAIAAHTEPHIIVSINCPGEAPARIRENRATLGRTNLFFWDLDHEPSEEEKGNIIIKDVDGEAKFTFSGDELCQPEDAVKVIDLVEAHPDAKNIVIHCTAGKSRSAAVAAALHKVLNGSDEPIFGNKRYRPNMRVYRMMLEEWYSRHPQD